MQTTLVQTGHDGDRRDLVATKGSGAEESEDDEKAGRGGSKKCGRPAERGPWVDDGGGKKEEINDVNNRYATVFSQEQKSFRLTTPCLRNPSHLSPAFPSCIDFLAFRLARKFLAATLNPMDVHKVGVCSYNQA